MVAILFRLLRVTTRPLSLRFYSGLIYNQENTDFTHFKLLINVACLKKRQIQLLLVIHTDAINMCICRYIMYICKQTLFTIKSRPIWLIYSYTPKRNGHICICIHNMDNPIEIIIFYFIFATYLSLYSLQYLAMKDIYNSSVQRKHGGI